MTRFDARACEYATEPRCRCRCSGQFHGRGYPPTDPRILPGDEHWAGTQLGLFPELAAPQDPEPVDVVRPGDRIRISTELVEAYRAWEHTVLAVVDRIEREDDGAVVLWLKREGAGSPAPPPLA